MLIIQCPLFWWEKINLTGDSELWFRERRNKVFLFNEANRRILAELQIDGEYSSNNSTIRKPKIILLGSRGFFERKNDRRFNC